MTSLGPSVLLRSAGLPVRLWLAASAPELFRLLRSLDEQGEKYCEFGRKLAERIGAELVPESSLSKRDRRLALALRRRLYNGRAVTTTDCKHIAALAARIKRSRGLAAELELAAAHSTQLSRLEDYAVKVVTAEEDRLLRTPWELLRASPIGEHAFGDGSLAVVDDIQQRLARGESWRSRRLCQASDYLWRMIARGAVKTTPRAWFGHVALVLVDEQGPDRGLSCGVAPEFASEWTENVHAQRRDLLNHRGGPIAPDIHLAFTPLHQLDSEEFRIWAIDPSSPTRVSELSMRRTSLLSALHTALRAGAKPLCELEAILLPAEPREEEREVFRSFLSHLVQLGVLQMSRPPLQYRTGWQTLGSTLASPVVDATSRPIRSEGAALSGFLDIYRRAEGTLSADRCRRWQRSIEQVFRVMALINADAPQPKDPLLERVGRRCCPALEIIAERLRSNSPEAESGRKPATAWPLPRTPGSGYDRLLEWIALGVEANAPLDITPDLLDSLGAPDRKLAWPLDCLVRPLASGGEAVLSQIAPAGVLDARFVSTLEHLHCQVPHATAYQSFLEQVEKETGIGLVELLVPPLSEFASNAVRRPLYTRAWTGDPDLRTYCEVQDPLPKYLPLGDLMVHRKGDELVVEENGKPVWPMYHATRMPLPPWDQLMNLLLRYTSPQRAAWGRRLRYSLTALPSRAFVPRITVGGDLILSTAQWRLTANQLWDSAVSSLAKARALGRLRDELGLPRWVFVSAPPVGQSFPCDLDSLRAIRVLERVATLGSTADIVAEEMVPAPDQLPVSVPVDRPGDRVAAELMLRFPCDESPSAMAARVASALGFMPMGSSP